MFCPVMNKLSYRRDSVCRISRPITDLGRNVEVLLGISENITTISCSTTYIVTELHFCADSMGLASVSVTAAKPPAFGKLT